MAAYACAHCDAGNEWSANADGEGRPHRFYTIRLLPKVTTVDGLKVEDDDRGNAVAFMTKTLKEVGGGWGVGGGGWGVGGGGGGGGGGARKK